MQRLKNAYRSLDADRTVGLWFALWWVINLVTAAFTELANDEAYYHIYADTLAFGYFDHPPVTALLVWLGERLFGGELGVRFFFTLLQPAYLLVLWRLVRPADACRRDGELFVSICAAMLILQLYGFIAVPDGPLLMSAALFLWAFRLFADGKRMSWLWLGLSVGFMAYCKYHGALVLIFTLLANAGLFIRHPRRLALLALSFAVASVTLIPHLVWQYEHDWASFAYHLSGRNGIFRLSNITDFAVNIAVIFSPFYIPLWVQAYRKVRPATPVERALWIFPPAFILFFAATAFRGYVQPQWTIAAVFGLIWILFAYARRRERTRRYTVVAAVVTAVLAVLVRVEMIFNPLNINFEIFNNRTWCEQIAEAADGRPVVFGLGYTRASKYRFYADTDSAFSNPCVDMTDEQHPNANYRSSQWRFRDDDRRFIGREVLVEVAADTECREEIRTLRLADGRMFRYIEVDDFRTAREVEIEPVGFRLPREVHSGDRFDFALRIRNPYPYEIAVDGDEWLLQMVWAHRTPTKNLYPLTSGFVLPPHGERVVECSFEVPAELEPQTYTAGFAVRHRALCTWFCGRTMKTKVVR